MLQNQGWVQFCPSCCALELEAHSGQIELVNWRKGVSHNKVGIRDTPVLLVGLKQHALSWVYCHLPKVPKYLTWN